MEVEGLVELLPTIVELELVVVVELSVGTVLVKSALVVAVKLVVLETESVEDCVL